MASLRDLGLSKYEASAYRALLDVGPATANTISDESDVPMGRVYDVLNDLESAGLVRSERTGRPKRYAPVQPARAMDNLLAEKKSALQEQAEHYEETAAELTAELSAPPTDGEFWTTAIGHDDAIDLAFERIDAAEETLCVAAGDPNGGFDLSCETFELADRVESAADRGVLVRLLGDARVRDAIPASAVERWETELAAHENIRLRTTDDLPGTFVGLDSIEVCVEIPNPLDRQELLGLVALRDAAFATRVSDAFGDSWNDADPV